MIDIDSYWHDQIHSVMPDIEIKKYVLHREGIVNDVVIVNDRWVIRFTKTDWGKELLALEDCLMRFLHPLVTLKVPFPEIRQEGVLVYSLLGGETFLRPFWSKASETQQAALAEQLGRFLWSLHTAPVADLDWEVPETMAPVSKETWADIHARVIEKVEPLLIPHQVVWMEDLFARALEQPNFFDFEPALIHGDLAPYHLLFLPEEGVLNGVIDFGVAGMGDPATDLGSLINYYGETLVEKIKPYYPKYDALLPRARFYAQALELQWVLLGVESGERYWFTAHLGGALDIGE
jgi:aminoglycoside 2''-phosphotransferase